MSDLCYLVADIGATHARFQCCELKAQGAPSLLGEPLILSTGLLGCCCDSCGYSLAPGTYAGALIAVAGPVDLSTGDVTVLNTGLLLPHGVLENDLSRALWDDFYAQAHAVPYLHDVLTLLGKSAWRSASCGQCSTESAAGSRQWFRHGSVNPGTGKPMARTGVRGRPRRLSNR